MSRPRSDRSAPLTPPLTRQPHISFACLIAMAILDSPTQKLTVSEIYEWMKVLAAVSIVLMPDALPLLRIARRRPGLEKLCAPQSQPEPPLYEKGLVAGLACSSHGGQAREDDEAGKGAAWAIRPDSLPQLAAAVARQAKV